MNTSRSNALAEFLANWEAEHGSLTVDEIAQAAAELGLCASDSAASSCKPVATSLTVD